MLLLEHELPDVRERALALFAGKAQRAVGLRGDIAISVDIAAANAAELGHSTETEVKILILHGLLHLAGYDHESDNGDMQARERELRQHLKLPTGLIERASAGAPQSAERS